MSLWSLFPVGFCYPAFVSLKYVFAAFLYFISSNLLILPSFLLPIFEFVHFAFKMVSSCLSFQISYIHDTYISCREVMTNYYWPSEPFHPRRHFIITTTLVFTAMFISLLTTDLGIVLEITGSTSAVAIAFLLPPLCYMHLTGAGEWRSWSREKKWWGPALCTGFAGGLMVISIGQVVVEIIRGEKL